MRATEKHENLAPMRRLLALAGLFLLLTGCGGADGRAPFVESRIPPALGPGYWPPDGWAWGLIGLGEAPVQRYGVSSTTAAPRGNLLILTDDGQTAEAWFQTARALNARGYTVWVLERAGQGGSARYSGPRDLIHAPSFDDDVATTRALARMIVVGDRDTPLTLVGRGVGGLVALRAAQARTPATRLVLLEPRLAASGGPALPDWLLRTGVGRLPAGWGQSWKRERAPGEPGRLSPADVQHAWQTANPDLRMGGHSLGWNAAFATAAKTAEAGLATTRTETVLVGGDAAAQDACRGMSRCKALPDKAAVEILACLAPPHPKVPLAESERSACAA